MADEKLKKKAARPRRQKPAQSKSVAADLPFILPDNSELERKLKRQELALFRLQGWLRAAELNFKNLLASNRYRLGDSMANALTRLRGQDKVQTAADALLNIFSEFNDFQTGEVRNTAENGEILCSVVVCVHNALADVQRCLDAVLRHSSLPYELIIVDDGSDAECADYLKKFAELHGAKLLRHPEGSGYTRAANRGLKAAAGKAVILLNSDTVVSSNWLQRLWDCAQSDKQIGLVGPLSNAATWQSVPNLVDRKGGFAVNRLAENESVEAFAHKTSLCSPHLYPHVPLLNGFCLLIKREVVDAIGLLDEEAFPRGYGEENDYCLRAADRGFKLAIADDCYVYHAGSKSYGDKKREALVHAGQKQLERRYGRPRIVVETEKLHTNASLALMRRRLGEKPRGQSPSLLFLLPAAPNGGGAHCVVQEASALFELKSDVKVAVPDRYLNDYQQNYAHLRGIQEFLLSYSHEHELQGIAAAYDVAIATHFSTMGVLEQAARANKNLLPAYYVQDYEPWFCVKNPALYQQARASYGLIPGTLLFAKTDWLCELVQKEHGLKVHKVASSLDHQLFYPRAKNAQHLSVVAMIRPRTPYRGPARTMQILRRLKKEFPAIHIAIFGCSNEELASAGLGAGFDFDNHGELSRVAVARLLGQASLFLDLSDFQAFGLAALEAMACGAAVVLPKKGGSGEYAVHKHNCMVVDSEDEQACYEAARALVVDPQLLKRVQENALKTAGAFNSIKAAQSEWDLIKKAHKNFSAQTESR